MRPFYPLILIFLLVSIHTAYTQPFLKHYSTVLGNESVVDAVIVPNEGYALLTDGQLAFLDANGTLLRQWKPVRPAEILYSKLARTSSGKFIVLAEKNDNTGLVLYLINQNGTLDKRIDVLQQEKVFNPEIREGSGGIFYFTYRIWVPGGMGVQATCMTDNGVEVWKKDLPGVLHYKYGVDKTPAGGLVVAYINTNDRILKLANITAAGDITMRDVTKVTNLNELLVPTFCVALPGGGYIIAGTEDVWNTPKNADMIVVRIDGDGNLLNKIFVDGKMMDDLRDIQVTGDAIYLLSQSGKKSTGVESQEGDDFVVSSVRSDGNLIWKRGYGNGDRDVYGKKLLTDGNKLVIAANGTTDGRTPSIVLIQTGQDGNAMDNQLAESIQTTQFLKNTDLLQNASTVEMISSVPTTDGGFISSGKLILKGKDDYTACVFRTDAQGRSQWLTLLSNEVSRPGNIKATPDGNYVLVLTNFFGQNKGGHLVKINGDGTILWKKETNFLFPEDVVATSDGGYLVIGAYPKRQDLTITMRRLDANGEIIWTRDYHEKGRVTEGKFITLTSDQQVAVAGIVKVPGNVHTGIYFMKTDLNGFRIKDFDLFKRDSMLKPECLLALSGKEVLIGGTANKIETVHRDAIVVKADAKGQLQWAHNYHISHRDEGYFLQQTAEQTYLLAGSTNDPVFGTRKKLGFIAVLNKDGAVSKKYFFGDQQSELHIRGVFQGAGNKFHITGSRNEQYHQAVPFIASFEPEIVLSAGNPVMQHHIKIYPNPARNSTTISINNQYAGHINITITGINGVRMKSLQLKKAAGVFAFRLPLEGVPAGNYQVELFFGKERVVKPIIVLPE